MRKEGRMRNGEQKGGMEVYVCIYNMATHFSILAGRILKDRGTWQATVHWGCKESDTTERLNTHTYTFIHTHIYITYQKLSPANLCGINTRTLQTGSLEISEVPFINPKEIMTCGIQSGTLSDASLICHHSLKMGSLCARTLSRFSPTLCDPMDYSPPGSSVNRIFPARILEWVAMPSSRGSSRLRDQTRVSCISCTPSRFFTCEPPTGR